MVREGGKEGGREGGREGGKERYAFAQILTVNQDHNNESDGEESVHPCTERRDGHCGLTEQAH